MLRKRTVFEPCQAHAAMYASETRARRAETMVEGGWPSPCSPEPCAMRPGTDHYTADFVAAHPTYQVDTPPSDTRR
jgi:anti-sigma factor RsiW